MRSERALVSSAIRQPFQHVSPCLGGVRNVNCYDRFNWQLAAIEHQHTTDRGHYEDNHGHGDGRAHSDHVTVDEDEVDQILNRPDERRRHVGRQRRAGLAASYLQAGYRGLVEPRVSSAPLDCCGRLRNGDLSWPVAVAWRQMLRLVTGVAVRTASRDIRVSPSTSTGKVRPADPI